MSNTADLKHWSRKSAGHKMIRNVPVIDRSFSIGDTSRFLSERTKNFKTIDYIYVLDDAKKFMGVFSIKDLYRLSPETSVEKICCRAPLVSVLPTSDQEEVAALALQHGLKAIPVVDEGGAFLGVIPHDAITAMVNKELREDILQMAGIHKGHAEFDNILDISLFDAIKHRLPWLLVGLGGGLLVASIISYFESTLENNLVLAAFIPLVVYIADAVRTQLEAFAIRDLAVFRKFNVLLYFSRQFFTVVIVAFILGALLSLVNYIFYGGGLIAIVLGSAIVVATLSSLFSGLLVPFMFRKFKIDPANASGPIGTIIQDILSVVIYFTIASLLI